MPIDPERVKVICFDIDGTLADTDDQMAEKLANFLPRPFFSSFKRLAFARKLLMAIETPANKILYLLDKIGLDDRFYKLRAKLFPRRKTEKPNWRLIPGVSKTLAHLAKNYSLAIISVREAHLTQSFIHQSGLTPFIHHWASAETTPHTKPYPDPIHWIAQRFGVTSGECLMVGDTTVDILAGKHAGAQTVGVLSGFGEEMELWEAGADEVIGDVNALGSLLKVSSPD
ncbi:MAG: phosphoglycolate phosphatase [Anaerolineales bacterium]